MHRFLLCWLLGLLRVVCVGYFQDIQFTIIDSKIESLKKYRDLKQYKAENQ